MRRTDSPMMTWSSIKRTVTGRPLEAASPALAGEGEDEVTALLMKAPKKLADCR